MRNFVISTVLILLSFLSASSYAWGPDGHRVGGEIAWQYLNPEVREEVTRLLAIKGEPSLAEAGTWADRMRSNSSYDWVAPLHYINLPVQWNGYRKQRDCPKQGCILEAINTYQRQLADTTLSDAQRAEALLLLVHFVEDIHQPMHTGLREDRGGNDVEVQFYGFTTNLHALWDVFLPAGFVSDWQQYSRAQPANITASQRTEWLQATPEQWAKESHQLAHANAYPKQAALGEDYYLKNREVVALRLQQAGVRLAGIINSAFAGGGK
ncbi:S1/P1 nuclease [uncultured Microbulbifer sp.]|uniref:S1/P1 nuclease n=1 Tax=uncultured Microbulbifer sp. TaxID=348147 RepID=UPI0025D65957|nr:S1/P1 nuclease [uncultured Microbulbifer sp.]